MTDKAREEFEAWAKTQDWNIDLLYRGGYVAWEVQFAFDAWQASRATMQEIAEKAFMAGWEASGEGWNAEHPGDAHQTESFITRRNEAFEGFGLLKVKP